jgi:adenylylsulfate kinase
MKELPCTVWLTGLSAAGKTTLAHALAADMIAKGMTCEVLDGDLLRQTLCRDLGFSPADRRENVRRVATRCRQLNDAGTIAIVALISPYHVDREMARDMVGTDRFLQVYMSTPLSVCETRDPKGLYKRARAGEITNLTGVGDVYEIPLDADLSIDTSRQSTEISVAAALRQLGLECVHP